MKKKTEPKLNQQSSFNHEDSKSETWLSENLMSIIDTIVHDDIPIEQPDDNISLYKDFERLNERMKEESRIQENRLSLNHFISFVEESRIWNGVVLGVQDNTFTAHLEEQDGECKSRIVEIKKTKINKDDWDAFFKEGFEFEWVFQKVNIKGTVRKRDEIRFTPITLYRQDEVSEMVNQALEDFSYMFKEENG